MIEDLIKYFKETPREQILKDWEESKELDKIGISALEYISKIDFLDTKIDDCDLSIRTKNICRINGFKVIRDLIAYSTKDLMMLHFGKRTISEIQEFLFLKGILSVRSISYNSQLDAYLKKTINQRSK